MKHPERVEDYLEHIAQAIDRAMEYTQRLGSVAAFQQNQRDQDAVIRNIEIIGEAACRGLTKSLRCKSAPRIGLDQSCRIGHGAMR